jgi:hypothetical protein
MMSLLPLLSKLIKLNHMKKSAPAIKESLAKTDVSFVPLPQHYFFFSVSPIFYFYIVIWLSDWLMKKLLVNYIVHYPGYFQEYKTTLQKADK